MGQVPRIVYLCNMNMDMDWRCVECGKSVHFAIGVDYGINRGCVCIGCGWEYECLNDYWCEYNTFPGMPTTATVQITIVDYAYAKSLADRYPEYKSAVTTCKL